MLARLTNNKTRTLVIAFLSFLCFLFYFKSYPSRTRNDIARSFRGPGVPRIAKVSMLYGQSNSIYERALRSHRWHNERWDYPFHILRYEIAGGFWNKPSYLLSLIVNELAKPPQERMEWLM